MSVATRLIGFAALLAAVFALAAFAGDRADLGKSEAADSAAGEHGDSPDSGEAGADEGHANEARGEGSEHGAAKI